MTDFRAICLLLCCGFSMPSTANENNWTYSIGLNANGNMIFTESSGRRTHNIDLSKITYSFGLFFEHNIDQWSYGVSIYGPELSTREYDYNLFDIQLSLKKKFGF